MVARRTARPATVARGDRMKKKEWKALSRKHFRQFEYVHTQYHTLKAQYAELAKERNELKAHSAYWGMKKERDELRKQLAETQDKLEAVSEAYEKNTAQGIRYERECFDLRKQLDVSHAVNDTSLNTIRMLGEELTTCEEKLETIRDWVRRQPGCPQDAEIEIILRHSDDKLWIDVVSETLASETWEENDCADPLWNQYNLIPLSELLTLRNQLARDVTKRHEVAKENDRVDEQELIAIEDYYSKPQSEISIISAIQDIRERLLPALKACQQQLNKHHSELYDEICTLRNKLREAQKEIRIAYSYFPDDPLNAKETLGSYMNINHLEELKEIP